MAATTDQRPRPPANPLAQGPILPTLLRLAAPNAMAMVASAGVAIAETAYVGRLGVASLAAVALVFPLLMLMQMMSGGAMGGGISSAVSRALGAGDRERARALAGCAAVIGLCGGLAGLIIFRWLGPAIFSALGGKGEALTQAIAFGGTAGFGVLAIWLTNCLASVLRGSGRMAVSAGVVLAASVSQVLIGGGLAFGIGPLPRLGIVGVALGGVIAFSLAAGVFFFLLTAPRAPLRLRLDGEALKRRNFVDILRIGAVGCLSPFFSVASTLVLTGLVARFGEVALAGYGIGVRLEFLLVPVAFAIGVASTPMVGVAVGGGDIARARQVAWTAGAAAALSLGAIGLVAMAAPRLWTSAFTRVPDVVDIAALYLRVAGIGFGFLGLGMGLYFASQGAGRIGGPILAQAGRFATVVLVGGALTAAQAPLWTLFALVALSMLVMGLGSAAALRLTPWR